MPRILIVDDDVVLCRLLKNFLQIHNMESDSLYNGEDAHALFSSPEYSRYDLLLLDVTMPGKDGFEVLQAIRANSINIPVIMWTASGNPADKREAYSSGADYFFFKPCDPHELVARINALLNARKALVEN